jgi:hypothetical protein
VVPNSEFKPEELDDVPQRALMDLGGVFKASSYWSNAWKNPKLDSRYGIHSARGQSGVEQWW